MPSVVLHLGHRSTAVPIDDAQEDAAVACASTLANRTWSRASVAASLWAWAVFAQRRLWDKRHTRLTGNLGMMNSPLVVMIDVILAMADRYLAKSLPENAVAHASKWMAYSML